jgi:hypothetical protein
LLGGQLRLECLDASDIATRSCQAGGEARFHEISSTRRDDRDRVCYLSHVPGIDGSFDDKNVDRSGSDQFGSEVRDLVVSITVCASFGDDVPPVDPAKFSQALEEEALVDGSRWRRPRSDKGNSMDLARLRLGRARCGEETTWDQG